jgi:hypothetical protein
MIIRDDQVQALADSYVRTYKLGLRQRLRARYPDRVANLDDVALDRVIDQGWEDAARLLIADYDDRARLIELPYVLRPDQVDSPFVQSVVLRVLNWLDRPAAQRLDFLYAHLVGRAGTSSVPQPPAGEPRT